MVPMQKPSYELQSAIVAIRKPTQPGDVRSLATLDPTCTVIVHTGPDHLGLVHVSCECGEFLVFQKDLELRATPLNSTSGN
jgi:hypothetical protein